MTLEILKGLKSKYEMHHKVVYTEKALEAAVYLSQRYVPDQFLPDKAIDVMDEAGARARLKLFVIPSELQLLKLQIDSVRSEKETAVASQDYERAAELKAREQALREEYNEKYNEWRREVENKVVTVDVPDIEEVVAGWTGIPLKRLESQNAKNSLNLRMHFTSVL